MHYIRDELRQDTPFNELNCSNIMLNFIVADPSHIVNFLVLVVKQYIYRTKCLRSPLSLNELISELETVQNMCHVLT